MDRKLERLCLEYIVRLVHTWSKELIVYSGRKLETSFVENIWSLISRKLEPTP
jgi:hypothetical protein